MVRAKNFKASEDLFNMVYRSFDLCAMSAQPVANGTAWMRSVSVFDLAMCQQSLNTEPFKQ